MADENSTLKIPESDITISSRVRLARNLEGFPFPSRMNLEQSSVVLNKVKDAIFKGNNSMKENYQFVEIGKLDPLDKLILVEKHLISPDMAGKQANGGVIISKDETISIMINEEDHIRIQCLFPGMQISTAWNLCSKVDELLEESLDYDFSSEFGYLTCCPTNIGTGIRASVMLHLPALVMTGYIRKILEACGKLNIAVRGIYGENSEASGNMFQVSNQITLGQNEDEIVMNVNNVALQIIEHEKVLRKELYKQNPYRFEDRVYRSLGLFANARIMSSEECMKLISDVRLGLDMGIIKDINKNVIDEIMLLAQPANLQKLIGEQHGPEERDLKRAELIRNKLK